MKKTNTLDNTTDNCIKLSNAVIANMSKDDLADIVHNIQVDNYLDNYELFAEDWHDFIGDEE